jgi:MFS superfamily sulfate permease-like transporter
LYGLSQQIVKQNKFFAMAENTNTSGGKKNHLGIFQHLNADLPAGLVVFLVALPLCLGIALASTGRPELLFSGIIAGVVGGIIVGALSGSPLGVSGPAAGLVVIVFTAIQTLGSYEAFLLAVVISGIIQLAAGFLKAGVIGYYFPSSVIKGMLAAIGLILILKEIPHALGYDEDFVGDMSFVEPNGENTFSGILHSFNYISPGAVIISLISLALLFFFDKPFIKKISFFKFVPGALFVVVLGIVFNQIFLQVMPTWAMTGKHLVQLPVASSPQEFLSFFTFPDFSSLTNPDVYVVAFTLAIVASIETLLCVEATDKLDPYKRNTPTNRELKAQGVGNLISGLIGGLPVTQVIVRSSANINSGGKTKMSAIFHGVILLLAAIAIPSLLNLIPLASLAAILLMVGYKLSNVSLYKGMYKLGWDQFLPFIVTVVAILMTDLLKGIGIGMVVAIYFILRKNYKHSYHYKKEEHHEGETITLVLSEEVTFLNKGSIQLTLDNLPHGSTVIVDGRNSVHIDYDVLEIIQDFEKFTAPSRDITVITKGIDVVKSVGAH